MPIKPLELLDRVTTATFALTIAFSFCGLFLVPSGQSILSNLLVASSVFGLLNYFIGEKKDVFFTDRRLVWVFIFYAVMILINRMIHGDQYGVMRSLFYVAAFSLTIPRKKILLSIGSIAILSGGIGLGLLSIWQYKNGIARVDGFTNAILFSQAAITLAVLNWYLFVEARRSLLIKLCSMTALAAALVALYFSQSRGVWLALGIIISYVVIYKATFKPWKYSVVALLFIIGIGGIYHTNTLVQSRMASAVSDINNMESGTYNSSWGLRVVAWESAWLGFLDSPWIGVGTDGFTVVKEQQIAQGLVSPLVMDPALAHAHSQYMQNLVLRGAVGILALVIFLFYPMKLIIEKAGWGSPYTMIPLSFAVNALSDVPFEHQNTLYLYALSLVFCWCAIEFNTEKK
ncbi:O-antigen ligase family protein [Aeromonas hydrophila]|uniref:Polymerase n=1 Tax=Aeromonas hydrophila TaxID=644 RepID=A0ABD7GB22_AERHY|nr:O-antigen ligase family protein [Aeromonas hydrophila]MBC8672854.1 O-antigen ligase family protein [Aeromonas hydrophila]MBC8688735.1 O-antigen ligase family protein [Aeromonas hydrophila]RCF51719.1 polymerase [Aeromonas hydrophila]